MRLAVSRAMPGHGINIYKWYGNHLLPTKIEVLGLRLFKTHRGVLVSSERDGGFSHEPVLFLPHKPSDSSHSQPSLLPRISTILHTIARHPVDTGETEPAWTFELEIFCIQDHQDARPWQSLSIFSSKLYASNTRVHIRSSKERACTLYLIDCGKMSRSAPEAKAQYGNAQPYEHISLPQMETTSSSNKPDMKHNPFSTSFSNWSAAQWWDPHVSGRCSFQCHVSYVCDQGQFERKSH